MDCAGDGELRDGELRCGELRCGELRCGELRCGELRGTDPHGASLDAGRDAGLALTTVREAIMALVKRQVLYKVPSIGTFVSEPKD
ncbi:hypothetical protein [Microbispora hainanensis]